ncbi:MAG: hypothetical protein LBC23_00625 [Coriobacteriales bacterium]|jgi:hypothetical protein|nr:hypothetical protein [Coriobacteriales bacterium]
MAAIEVSCSQCGSGEYRVVNTQTGEVACAYCRNQWIVPELAQKSETEKFLEQQAKQPRIVRDNTTETDQQLMSAISGLASVATGGFFAGLGRTVRRIITAAIVIVAVLVIAGVAFFIYKQIV